MSKLLTYDPSQRLSASEVMQHPFLADLYDPGQDLLKPGEPISYFDFEFEQYTINNEIIRELLIDEIILTNSAQARKMNDDLRKKFP